MSYESSNISWGANQLSAMVKNERIVFGNIIQRSLVWEQARKSLFIHSLCIGIPIPPTYAKRFDDGSGKRNSNVYDMLDGKQRFSTIAQFLGDEFALTTLPPVSFFNVMTNEDEVEDISGKKFSELSEGLQEKIKNARISIVFFDNLTKEEERELFKRLNNGKPLSTKSRALASCLDIENLLDIGSHSLFTEMLTEKARENKNQAQIIMKVWSMLNQDIEDVSFESKDFNPLLENTEISDDERLKMVQIFDFVLNTHSILLDNKEKKVARKMYTETHFISLVPYFNKAVEDGIEEKLVADWLVEFFKPIDGSTSVSESYNEAAGKGSAKNSNVKARNTALSESFYEFFKIDDIETNIVDDEELNENTEDSTVETESNVEDDTEVNDTETESEIEDTEDDTEEEEEENTENDVKSLIDELMASESSSED